MTRMVRTQISLTREQAEGLGRLARERGVSMAAVVRDAIDAVLQKEQREERWQRALAMLGKLPGSGLTDISENHDQYLAEAFYDWHTSSTARRSTRSSTPRTRTTRKR